MSVSKTDGLCKAELKKKLDEFYEHPLINIYLAQKKQVDSIAEQISSVYIDFTDEDSVLFKNWLAWSDKSPKIAEGLESMRQKIDPDELRKAEAEKLKAIKTSPESWANRRKSKMSTNNDKGREGMS